MAVQHISNICHFCSDWVTSVAEVEHSSLASHSVDAVPFSFLLFFSVHKRMEKKIISFRHHIFCFIVYYDGTQVDRLAS